MYCNMGQPYCNVLQYTFCHIVSPPMQDKPEMLDCPSVYLSVHKILVSVKALAGV